MSAANPYAPPRDAPIPETALPPLPDGIRRYSLEPRRLHEYIARFSRRVMVRLLLFCLALAAILAMVGPLGRDALIILWLPMLGSLVIAWMLQHLRASRVEPKLLEGYELLVGPRVLRRTTYGAPPAEILAPEVTSIAEIPDGLSIVSSPANGRLLVLRSLAGYAELRDQLARWRPIERRDGVGAWLRKRAHRGGERTRDRVLGTVLENDDALFDELRALRAIARTPDWKSIRQVQWRRRLNVALWVFLGLFVCLWIFLTPRPREGATSAPVLRSNGH